MKSIAGLKKKVLGKISPSAEEAGEEKRFASRLKKTLEGAGAEKVYRAARAAGPGGGGPGRSSVGVVLTRAALEGAGAVGGAPRGLADPKRDSGARRRPRRAARLPLRGGGTKGGAGRRPSTRLTPALLAPQADLEPYGDALGPAFFFVQPHHFGRVLVVDGPGRAPVGVHHLQGGALEVGLVAQEIHSA